MTLRKIVAVPPTVVAVDDDPVQLATLVDILAQNGVEVHSFPSAKDALAAMGTNNPPDLIVIGLHKIGLDSWDFCRQLRSPEFHFLNKVPVIVIAAPPVVEEASRLVEEFGQIACFSTPLDGVAFLDLAKSLLASENALWESESQFRQLTESLPLLIWSCLADGPCDYLGPQWVAYTGVPEADQLGYGWLAQLHPEDRERVVAEWEESVTSGVFFDVEFRIRRHDGVYHWFKTRAIPIRDNEGILQKWFGVNVDIEDLKRSETAQEQRLVGLTRPLDDSSTIAFEDLFNLADIQRMQDEFANATGVASIITAPDGTPITKPSSFCRLCIDIIRQTEKGLANCIRSDAVIGQPSELGPVIQPCMSGGLWDAGAGILVGGHHIANWLIGQVRDETQTEEQMRQYAREIGANEDATVEAFREVPSMSLEQFGNVAQALHTLASQLSASAYQNVQQARFITDRQAAEAALRESEDRHRRILESMRIGIVAHGPDTGIQFANQEASRILGLTMGQLQGTTAMDPAWRFVREDETTMPHDEFPANRVQATLQPVKEQIIGVDRPVTGDRAWVSVNAYPEFGPDQKLLTIVVTFIDITERMCFEAERAKLENQLQQAHKMESVGRLAGGVAHDFNNMLGVVLGHTEIALDQVAPGDPLHAELLEIQKAGERSADLTRQLLAFARKQTIAPKVVDLNQTVEGMLTMLRRLIGEDIELSWLPGGDLWPVKVDPTQLDQILANLCVNARDAIADVGRITIETGNTSFDEAYCQNNPGFIVGEYIRLTLSDDGSGMARETLDSLFEPFFTTKGVGKGTGLGLATVYGIVKQNSGFINVYSEPGQGTTFNVYLARYQGLDPQVGITALSEPIPRGHENILVVEDEPALLEITTLILKRLGYTVLAASSPREAIRLAQEYPGEVHLLLTDVVMPEMNGRDLANKLLELEPGLKRLFMSGYTANVIAHHGVLDDGVFFIQKPFSKQDLAAMVRQTLDE